jgi:hypothetical protein
MIAIKQTRSIFAQGGPDDCAVARMRIAALTCRAVAAGQSDDGIFAPTELVEFGQDARDFVAEGMTVAPKLRLAGPVTLGFQQRGAVTEPRPVGDGVGQSILCEVALSEVVGD